jgi:hypothetical protein
MTNTYNPQDEWKRAFEMLIGNNHNPSSIIKTWVKANLKPSSNKDIATMLSTYYPQYLEDFEKLLILK